MVQVKKTIRMHLEAPKKDESKEDDELDNHSHNFSNCASGSGMGNQSIGENKNVNQNQVGW